MDKKKVGNTGTNKLMGSVRGKSTPQKNKILDSGSKIPSEKLSVGAFSLVSKPTIEGKCAGRFENISKENLPGVGSLAGYGNLKSEVLPSEKEELGSRFRVCGVGWGTTSAAREENQVSKSFLKGSPAKGSAGLQSCVGGETREGEVFGLFRDRKESHRSVSGEGLGSCVGGWDLEKKEFRVLPKKEAVRIASSSRSSFIKYRLDASQLRPSSLQKSEPRRHVKPVKFGLNGQPLKNTIGYTKKNFDEAKSKVVKYKSGYEKIFTSCQASMSSSLDKTNQSKCTLNDCFEILRDKVANLIVGLNIEDLEAENLNKLYLDISSGEENALEKSRWEVVFSAVQTIIESENDESFETQWFEKIGLVSIGQKLVLLTLLSNVLFNRVGMEVSRLELVDLVQFKRMKAILMKQLKKLCVFLGQNLQEFRRFHPIFELLMLRYVVDVELRDELYVLVDKEEVFSLLGALSLRENLLEEARYQINVLLRSITVPKNSESEVGAESGLKGSSVDVSDLDQSQEFEGAVRGRSGLEERDDDSSSSDEWQEFEDVSSSLWESFLEETNSFSSTYEEEFEEAVRQEEELEESGVDGSGLAELQKFEEAVGLISALEESSVNGASSATWQVFEEAVRREEGLEESGVDCFGLAELKKFEEAVGLISTLEESSVNGSSSATCQVFEAEVVGEESDLEGSKQKHFAWIMTAGSKVRKGSESPRAESPRAESPRAGSSRAGSSRAGSSYNRMDTEELPENQDINPVGEDQYEKYHQIPVEEVWGSASQCQHILVEEKLKGMPQLFEDKRSVLVGGNVLEDNAGEDRSETSAQQECVPEAVIYTGMIQACAVTSNLPAAQDLEPAVVDTPEKAVAEQITIEAEVQKYRLWELSKILWSQRENMQQGSLEFDLVQLLIRLEKLSSWGIKSSTHIFDSQKYLHSILITYFKKIIAHKALLLMGSLYDLQNHFTSIESYCLVEQAIRKTIKDRTKEDLHIIEKITIIKESIIKNFEVNFNRERLHLMLSQMNSAARFFLLGIFSIGSSWYSLGNVHASYCQMIALKKCLLLKVNRAPGADKEENLLALLAVDAYNILKEKMDRQGEKYELELQADNDGQELDLLILERKYDRNLKNYFERSDSLDPVTVNFQVVHMISAMNDFINSVKNYLPALIDRNFHLTWDFFMSTWDSMLIIPLAKFIKSVEENLLVNTNPFDLDELENFSHALVVTLMRNDEMPLGIEMINQSLAALCENEKSHEIRELITDKLFISIYNELDSKPLSWLMRPSQNFIDWIRKNILILSPAMQSSTRDSNGTYLFVSEKSGFHIHSAIVLYLRQYVLHEGRLLDICLGRFSQENLTKSEVVVLHYFSNQVLMHPDRIQRFRADLNSYFSKTTKLVVAEWTKASLRIKRKANFFGRLDILENINFIISVLEKPTVPGSWALYKSCLSYVGKMIKKEIGILNFLKNFVQTREQMNLFAESFDEYPELNTLLCYVVQIE